MVTDSRIQRFAELLVDYCIEGSYHRRYVGVTGTTAAEPLIIAVYEKLLKTEAFPVLRISFPEQTSIFFSSASDYHFTTLNKFELNYAKLVDAVIHIQSETNTRALSNISPVKQATYIRTNASITRMFLNKKWVLTLFPTSGYAQEAEMSLSEFEDFVYNAMYLDEKNPVNAWRRIGREQKALIRKIEGVHEVRILSDDTDLRFSITGRRFISSDGHTNMPSGEIYVAPVENSVEGHIFFDISAGYRGTLVSGVKLCFKKGEVVEAYAEKNESLLHTILDIDEGARRIGEFGIGTNLRIDRFIHNILFDEKVYGTIHLALGRSVHNSGGKNKSTIHWDMIKDMRKGGLILFDGKVFQRDGRFK